jgi:four helix bundle protein
LPDFEESEVWKQARLLTQRIYQVTSRGPFRRDFYLLGQTRKAAVSIMANIAEGMERAGHKELRRFLRIAKGSAGELRSHVCVAHDAGHLDQGTFRRLHRAAREIGAGLGGWVRCLSQAASRESPGA